MLSRLMKRTASYLFLASLIGLVYWVQPVSSTVMITAPDGYAIACAANYTRRLPHYCIRNGTQSSTLILDATCRSVNFSVSSAKVIKVDVYFDIFSANSVAMRSTLLNFFSENTCTTPGYPDSMSIDVFEEVAKASARLSRIVGFNVDVVTDSSGILYYQGTTCAACVTQISIVAYYD